MSSGIARGLRKFRLKHYKHEDRIIKVSVPNCNTEVKDWLDEHVYSAQTDAVGFDAEWAPSFTRGRYSPVSLVQVATPQAALLVQCNAFGDARPSGDLPRDMVDLIQNESVIKVGVGVYDDLVKVSRDYQFSLDDGAWMDIGSAARRCGVQGPTGLASLTETLMGVKISKPKNVQMSNWAKVILSPKQVEYAAYDAVMSADVFWALRETPAFDDTNKHVISDMHVYPGERPVIRGLNVDVCGRNDCRLLWLYCCESSTGLLQAAAALRTADEKLLLEVQAAQPHHELNKNLASNGIDKNQTKKMTIPTTWRSVVATLLSRYAAVCEFTVTKNDAESTTVRVMVNSSVLSEAKGRNKAAAAELASWNACRDLLHWQVVQPSVLWFNACAGKGQYQSQLIFAEYLATKPQVNIPALKSPGPSSFQQIKGPW
jgi:hypothetical protein